MIEITLPQGLHHAPGVITMMLQAADIQVIRVVDCRMVNRHTLGKGKVQAHHIFALVHRVIGVIRHALVNLVGQRVGHRAINIF